MAPEPGGRSVRAMRRRADTNPWQHLQVCRYCGSDFVIPVHYAPSENDFWIRLRCGECERRVEVVVDHDTAQRYDLDLTDGMIEIALAADWLQGERMVDAGVFAR